MRAERGFTLLETLIALAVLSVAAAAILTSLSVETDSLRRSKAAESASNTLEELLGRVAAHRSPLSSFSEGRSSDGRWIWRVAAENTTADVGSTLPGLQDVTIGIAPAENAPSQAWQEIHTRHFGVGPEKPL